MAVPWRTKKGKDVVLLNPSEKAGKYALELRDKKRYTNGMIPKTDGSGKEMALTKEQAAFRSGYLQAQKDSANCFKAREAKRGRLLPYQHNPNDTDY